METVKRINVILISFCLLIISCSTEKQIASQARNTLLEYQDLNTAHIGISIFDPAAGKYLYDSQGSKYFIPASNTKLFTLYAGMKYLPDSLVAARYKMEDETVVLQATGDPTFLHPDFTNQPLFNFLQRKEIRKISINTAFAAESFGAGWSWEDYKDGFMAERDPFPIYGNMATIIFSGDSVQTIPSVIRQSVAGFPRTDQPWKPDRRLGAHFFIIDTTGGTLAREKKITMAMEKGTYAAYYLADTLHKEVVTNYTPLLKGEGTPIYSQPKDSLFAIMMHRSDNFYAEQILLMVSEERNGIMNDVAIIDTLLLNDLYDLPQKPRWADGSGLSRYNLFSPKDFIWVLNKLKDEFGMERLKIILPGAEGGTLSGLYTGYEHRIYAKTGSLSNNLSLSGYMLTKKNRSLLFSVMINNYNASAAAIRKQIEKFLTGIIDKY